MAARRWEWIPDRTVRDRGATIIEWALIVSLICLVVVVGASLIGLGLDLRSDGAVRP